MASTDPNPDPRYYGCNEAVVTDNRDKLGVGRVRIRVEGLFPEEGGPWAFPMGGSGGGAAGRGQHDPPDVGAEVYVWFIGGDPDKARYIPGHHIEGEETTAVAAAKAAAGTPDAKIDASLQVKTIHETKDWEIVVDEREGLERLYIRNKGLGEDLDTATALMIELDRNAAVLALVGLAGVAIRSAGTIALDASIITIGGRKVVQGIEKPI